jgi:hypothetical protein
MTKARAEAITEFAAYVAEHLRQGVGNPDLEDFEHATAEWIEMLAEEWTAS